MDVPREIMLVASRKGMLFLHVILINLLGYFKAMRSCEAKLRYFDWDGQVHIAKGKTGGQQGDPLEMLIFNLTVQHLWGRVLAKFQGSGRSPMLTMAILRVK
jgi:hypothetical protein